MDQAVDRRPLTAEVQFRSQYSHCEFCCGQSGTGTRYSPVLASSPGNIIPPIFDLIILLHLHVLPEVQVDEIWVTSERNAVSEIAKHGK
jgi:dTDP-glucose pyrophosphorylase